MFSVCCHLPGSFCVLLLDTISHIYGILFIPPHEKIGLYLVCYCQFSILNSQKLFSNQANFFLHLNEKLTETVLNFELAVLFPMRLCRKQFLTCLVISLEYFNTVLSQHKTNLGLSRLILTCQCQCWNKAKFGHHCQLIETKKKVLPYTCASFPFGLLFLCHLRKDTFICELISLV